MTRINTNVSSLNAQKTLAQSHASLQEALTRLSTGLRINSGKDDPAGLIASEVLRSDITSVQRAVANSQRANQMIATADSALGQVSSLLNDIRGLITQAANNGAMSGEQLAANQLQIDSSLDAIDRIATITEFQGRRLLDSNLDFITRGVDETKISNLEIDQANFGEQSEIPVAIDVVAQATNGRLDYALTSVPNDVVLGIGGSQGFEAFAFAGGTDVQDIAAAVNLVSDALGVRAEVQQGPTAGQIAVSSVGADNDILLRARTPGELDGNYRLKFVANGGALSVAYSLPAGNDPGTITVNLETEAWLPAGLTIDDGSALDNELSISSLLSGEQFNGVRVVADGTGTAGNESVSYDHALGELTLTFESGVSTAAQMIAAFNADSRVSKLFHMDNAAGSGGTGTLDATNPAWTVALLGGGANGGAILSTAAEVVQAINTTPGLSGAVEAALDDTGGGDGVVNPFDQYAFYGNPDLDNYLQFLGSGSPPRIRFASQPDQTLGIDLATDPRIEDYSSAVIQGTAAQTSIRLTAVSPGEQYDGVTIRYLDTGAPGQDAVVWNPENKRLDVYVQQGAATAAQVVNLINNDDYVASFFQAETIPGGGGTGTIDGADFGVDLATTDGGLSNPGTVIINLGTDQHGAVTTTAQDLVDYFNDDNNLPLLEPLGISVSNAEGSSGIGVLAPTTEDISFATSGTDMVDVPATAALMAVNGTNALVQVTALAAGAQYGGVTVAYEDTAAGPGAETAFYDPLLKVLTIGIDLGATTADDVINAINTDPGVSLLFVAQRGTDRAGATGDGTGLVTLSDGGILSAGVLDVGTQDGAAFLGNDDNGDTGLAFISTDYGTDAFVAVQVLQGGPFVVTDSDGNAVQRSVGTDIDARINGVQAIGHGLQASIHSSSLDLTLSVSDTVQDGDSTAFTIIGGGAQFQLGPDVISNQQARMGIASVNTAELGGISGRLFELRSGGTKSLENDIAGAARVADEVIELITTLRGRLGAFQRTTLETNMSALTDTLESLTEAESSIRDADFASETARLTRAQILVESGLSVLSIANQTPRNVLQLLQE